MCIVLTTSSLSCLLISSFIASSAISQRLVVSRDSGTRSSVSFERKVRRILKSLLSQVASEIFIEIIHFKRRSLKSSALDWVTVKCEKRLVVAG
jgi:hypothetical protein